MPVQIHKNNIGVKFLVTILDQDDNVVNLSTASVKQLIFLKPGCDDDRLVKTADFETDGTDGKIKYLSIAGDLDIIGVWRLQAYVEIGTLKLYSDITKFKVYENI